jgi:hypothetical protein
VHFSLDSPNRISPKCVSKGRVLGTSGDSQQSIQTDINCSYNATKVLNCCIYVTYYRNIRGHIATLKKAGLPLPIFGTPYAHVKVDLPVPVHPGEPQDQDVNHRRRSPKRSLDLGGESSRRSNCNRSRTSTRRSRCSRSRSSSRYSSRSSSVISSRSSSCNSYCPPCKTCTPQKG